MKKCTIETTDLNALLDSLTDGEHVKATWKRGEIEVTTEGPVHVGGAYCACFQAIRWNGGTINEELASFEVTRTEEITVTRDDEAALHALLDSLDDGQEVTAEWRAENRSMTLTGTTGRSSYHGHQVRGLVSFPMRWINNQLNRNLHSVTTHRAVMRRWEREKKAASSAIAHDHPSHNRATCTRCQLWGEKS